MYSLEDNLGTNQGAIPKNNLLNANHKSLKEYKNGNDKDAHEDFHKTISGNFVPQNFGDQEPISKRKLNMSLTLRSQRFY